MVSCGFEKNNKNAINFVCIVYICIIDLLYMINIELYKGISPGRIIDRELKKRGTSQRSFAAMIGEHSQNLNAVINGRRPITIELSYKLDKEFGYEDGFLAMLQTQYDYDEYKRRAENKLYPGRPDISKILFWDVDFDSIEWGYRKEWVIGRVMERGNDSEKAEIARFYGLELSELENYKPVNSYRINPEAADKTNR